MYNWLLPTRDIVRELKIVSTKTVSRASPKEKVMLQETVDKRKKWRQSAKGLNWQKAKREERNAYHRAYYSANREKRRAYLNAKKREYREMRK